MTLTCKRMWNHDSEVFHFRFEYGWATFIIIMEELCEFIIMSDWGNYSYRWPAQDDRTLLVRTLDRGFAHGRLLRVHWFSRVRRKNFEDETL